MNSLERRLSALEQWVGGIAKSQSGRPVSCRVYDDAAQTLTSSGTLYPIAFAHERWDGFAMHDTSTNNSRITLPVAGWYMICGDVAFAANATGSRSVFIRADGTAYIGGVTIDAVSEASRITEISVSTVYYFSAGAYVEVVARQVSGGALDTYIVAEHSPEFAVIRIG